MMAVLRTAYVTDRDMKYKYDTSIYQNFILVKLDNTAFSNFVDAFSLKNCLIVGDKGFLSNEALKKLSDEKTNIKYVFPIKRNDSRIIKNGLYDYTGTFKNGDDVIEFVKKKVDNVFFYSFKSIIDEANEKKGYIINVDKKESFNKDKLEKKEKRFGTIVFISNADIEASQIYQMYDKEREIETYFAFYKNIASLNNVRVQGDYSIIVGVYKFLIINCFFKNKEVIY